MSDTKKTFEQEIRERLNDSELFSFLRRRTENNLLGHEFKAVFESNLEEIKETIRALGKNPADFDLSITSVISFVLKGKAETITIEVLTTKKKG